MENTEYIAPDTTTAEWDSYPFEVNGYQFISKIRKNSSFAESVARAGVKMFEQMNIGCVRELIGNTKSMTRFEIAQRLVEVNRGGQNAIIELA